jgi:hypothetical protein
MNPERFILYAAATVAVWTVGARLAAGAAARFFPLTVLTRPVLAAIAALLWPAAIPLLLLALALVRPPRPSRIPARRWHGLGAGAARRPRRP